jgi:glutamate synthase (NADPH/NADH) small chain
MDFLTQQNRRGAGDRIDSKEAILATGKHVIIIGGGDTGADCLGTSHRHKAASVTQLEILPMPPDQRSPATPWPLWPLQLRQESSHEEGGARDWAVATTGFSGNGRVEQIHCVRLGDARQPIAGSDFTLPADLVLLAMGFTGPNASAFGLELDARGNVRAEHYETSLPGVFAAGDARRGQSLVVWAIAEGRKAAAAVTHYLGI